MSWYSNQVSDENKQKAYNEGLKAAQKGFDQYDNHYDWFGETVLFSEWTRGWKDGKGLKSS